LNYLGVTDVEKLSLHGDLKLYYWKILLKLCQDAWQLQIFLLQGYFQWNVFSKWLQWSRTKITSNIKKKSYINVNF